MENQKRWWLFWGPVLLTGLFLGVGCDNTLSPFAEETGQFSIHGLLTLSKQKHFIRIKDLNEPINKDSTRSLDATVTLENLATGQTETLTDSIVTFDGFFTHNFRTDQALQPGTSYQLRVERPDGRSSSATATLPPEADVELDHSKTDTVRCDGDILFRFQGMPLDGLVRISAAVRWEDMWRWTDQKELDLPVGGWNPWEIVRDALPDHVLQGVGRQFYCSEFLDHGRVKLAYIRFGPDWPADSVLANPVESNVKNGLGIFGGIHRDTLIRTVHTTPQ